MKKTVKIFVFSVLLFCCTTVSQSIQAQPHPPTDKGMGNNQATGAAAPVGNGTFLLLTLAMAYAGRKVYKIRANPSVE